MPRRAEAETPRKLVVDAETGAERYEELEGDELDEYNERQAAPPPPEPPPPVEQRIAEALVGLPDDAPFSDVKSALITALQG